MEDEDSEDIILFKKELKQQQMKWMADCLKFNKNPLKQWKKSLDISDEELAKFIEENKK